MQPSSWAQEHRCSRWVGRVEGIWWRWAKERDVLLGLVKLQVAGPKADGEDLSNAATQVAANNINIKLSGDIQAAMNSNNQAQR